LARKEKKRKRKGKRKRRRRKGTDMGGIYQTIVELSPKNYSQSEKN